MIRAISNPGQNAANLFKFHTSQDGCCPNTIQAPCQYTVTITDGDAVTGLNILDRDGNAATLPITSTTTVAGILAGIKAALLTAGYENDGRGVEGVTVTDTGSNIVIVITGEVKMVSIIDTGGPTAFTEACNTSSACTYFYAWPGNAGATTFTIDGVAASIAALTLAGNTAANVDTALSAHPKVTELGLGVAVVETGSAFEITITGGNSQFVGTITLDTGTFTRTCAETYSE